MSKAGNSNYDRPAGTGRVTLVGAGPGAADLLTLRGQHVLSEADTVIYDDLVNRDILKWCRPDTTQIYVGKRAGQRCMQQQQIGELLVREALLSQHVVRLKGGDPLVFGRGGEEMAALAEAGIPFDIVPGVTAAVAAGAAAGVPLTLRGTASAVIFVTGHECADKQKGAIDWAALARTGATLCIYMGARRLPEIARALSEGGLAGSTPVAVVANATLPQQSVHQATLETAESLSFILHGQPALIIVGEVVRWAELSQAASGPQLLASA
jgi:uroporphyrin-III C-methyltransferase